MFRAWSAGPGQTGRTASPLPMQHTHHCTRPGRAGGRAAAFAVGLPASLIQPRTLSSSCVTADADGGDLIAFCGGRSPAPAVTLPRPASCVVDRVHGGGAPPPPRHPDGFARASPSSPPNPTPNPSAPPPPLGCSFPPVIHPTKRSRISPLNFLRRKATPGSWRTTWKKWRLARTDSAPIKGDPPPTSSPALHQELIP